MSKDRYNDDHTIEIFGDEGKQTLFVKENLRVHSTTWTDELVCESLDADEIVCNDLTVRDKTVLGTGESTDSVTVKAASTFEKSATFEKWVTFLGTIDASDVVYSNFKAQGFKSTEGEIAIRAGKESSLGNITLSAYNDINLLSTRSDDNGGIFLESDKISIKATSNSLSSISITAGAGGTHIEHGAFLGGYDSGPVSTQYSVSSHKEITNTKTSSQIYAEGNTDYGTRVSNTSGGYPIGWFRDGWVTPKVECAYTHWQGFASAVGTDEDGDTGTFVKYEENTEHWIVSIPLPTEWDSDVKILGMTYSYRRWRNRDPDAPNMDHGTTKSDYEDKRRSGKIGVLEYIGGGEFPSFKHKYVKEDGSTGTTALIGSSGNQHNGFRSAAYVVLKPSGTSYHRHFVLRVAAQGEFKPANGMNKVGHAGTTTVNQGGLSHTYKNLIGIRVKILLWYCRKDT